MKTCSKCGQTKPYEMFFKDAGRNDGKTPQCKTCMKQAADARRETGKEAEVQAEWRKRKKNDPTYRASRLLADATQRAKKNGLPIDIDLEWVSDRIVQGYCEVTNLKFDLRPAVPARPFTPSLDRIDPRKGYTKENTRVVCWVYNRAKGVHSHSAVLILAEALCKKN